MKNHIVTIDGNAFELSKNYRDAYRESDFKERYTDYFQDFDYILGDYSYDKLRLKGFYEETSKKAKPMNSIAGLETYIQDFCSYECRYFLLKKLKK